MAEAVEVKGPGPERGVVRRSSQVVEQLELLAATPAPPESTVYVDGFAGLEGTFQALWRSIERTGCRATEAEAWRVADRIIASTGEDRLALLDRLVPDDDTTPPARPQG
jgi:hypothetical protein